MPLRTLLRYLLNNERLVQRLADSYPMRRLARACLAAFYRTQDAAGKSRLFERFKNATKEIKDREHKK